MTQTTHEIQTETAEDIAVRLNKVSHELERLSARIFKLTAAALISTMLLWGVAGSLLTSQTYISSNVLTAIQVGCVLSIVLGYAPIFLLSTFEKKTKRGYVALNALDNKCQPHENTDIGFAETATGKIDFPLHKEKFLKSTNVCPLSGPFTTMWYFRGRFRSADVVYLLVNIAVVLSSTYLLISTFPPC
jgi:hypothetical protein